MIALFMSDVDRADWWVREMKARLPELELRIWPDAGDLAEIEYTVLWKPPPGLLGKMPNLRAILSMGAGVDHILADPARPPDIPVSRVVDQTLTNRMCEYVLLSVLRYHRLGPIYEAQQKQRSWTHHQQPAAFERSVGILGLGVLGQAVSEQLVALGFAVSGWSRSPKNLARVHCYHGDSGLAPFLAKVEILICLLPLTNETADILNLDLFAQLPRGAQLINVARGGHLVEDDLLAALKNGQLAHATLDVLREEPPPENHPFWDHPQITLTPHVACISDPRSVADQVAENIKRAQRGETLLNQVDPARGY